MMVFVKQSNFYINVKKDPPRQKAVSRCQLYFKDSAVMPLITPLQRSGRTPFGTITPKG
jgi:hypothetical protein